MTTRLNRYYNDPNIGAAMSNLASIFAPPDLRDLAAAAQAQKVAVERRGLETLYGMAGDPNADLGMLDRWGAATGQWSPTSGFGARDMADATDRYGIDVGAATTMRGQDLTAESARYGHDRSLEASVFGDATRPLGPGEIRPNADPLLEAIGLPGIGEARGIAPILSTDEVEAQALAQVLTPGDARMSYLSDIPIEQILLDDGSGQPVVSPRGAAWGAEPFINPGSQPAQRFATYRTPDGRVGTAVLDPGSGSAVDQATGEPLPQGTITGDVTDAGGGALTGSTESDFQKRAFAITGALSTIDSLNALIAASPSSQGLVGSIRGTAQDIMQTGNELGRAFGGTIAEVNQAVASGLLDAGVAAEMYDPNIPAIDMLMNMLAWQYAKSMAGDRVSNEQLRMARSAIGGTGVFANQASSVTRLNELKSMLSEEGRRLLPYLGGSMASDLDIRLGGGAPPAISNAPGGPRIDPADAELFQRYGINP